MDISNVVTILEGGSALVGIAVAIRDWFRPVASGPHLDPNLKDALDRLPTGASADDIINVLQPFYASTGGDAAVRAGNDGGGNIILTNTRVEGGSGPGGGGNAVITGGDGGPHGNGGSVNIIGGIIKGGDAK